MSYDVAVWVGERPPDDAAALAEYIRLSEEHEESRTEEEPDPTILRFIGDLTARYPDLTTLPDDKMDESPWAVGPLTADVLGSFFYFSVVFSKAEEAVPFIAETARAHGLVCFDPQEGRLI